MMARSELRTGALCFLLLLTALSGCAGLTPRPDTPELAEQELFRSVSDFYCQRARWPYNFDELTGFIATRQPTVNLSMWFPNAKFESDRAIKSSVEYTNVIEEGRTRSAVSETPQEVPRKISFIAPPVCGDETVTPEIVSMAGGRISFRLPEGFEQMSSKDVRERWKDGPRPDVAWRRADTDVLLAIRFGEVNISHHSLPDLKAAIEQSYDVSVPGIVWQSKMFVRDSNPPYLVHQFESDSSRGRLVTHSVSLSFNEKLFTLHVIGPVAERDSIEQVGDTVRAELISNL